MKAILTGALVALTITAPGAHPAARAGAGVFGILALIIAAVSGSAHGEDIDRRRW